MVSLGRGGVAPCPLGLAHGPAARSKAVRAGNPGPEAAAVGTLNSPHTGRPGVAVRVCASVYALFLVRHVANWVQKQL